MEIEDDLDTISWQNILNALQLHVLAPSFIDTIMHLIEDTSDSSLSSLSSSSDEKAINILGCYGNSASLTKIAALTGVGHGTVDRICCRVITAIQKSNLRVENVKWPTGEAKETTKNWVENQVHVPAWRDGFCMVDGTLIPLYCKPSYYGKTFYDRKSRYSINVQIINTLNRQIIDYASGFRGSRHDTHCFKSTRLGKRPFKSLDQGEWCWGDQGYLLCKWLMISYKSPVNLLKENCTFNYHLSRIRIRSEHAIGYLKGRFQSLKELRIQITNRQNLAYATLWINCCIILHAFCINHEQQFVHSDWLKDDIDWERHQRQEGLADENRTQSYDRQLNEGKKVREQLKRALLSQLP